MVSTDNSTTILKTKFCCNNYTILDKIGSGGYGEVFLIEDITDKKYAMKVLLFKNAYTELGLLAKLKSPNIVECIEYFHFDFNICIVMEYCEKGDLEKQIERTKELKILFDNPLIYKWTNDILNGIHYLHSNNVKHRDIKPKNLFLTKDEHVKIGDFGASYLKDIDDTVEKTETKQTYAGTLKYMSPEMRESRKYSFNTDIWSIGCVLYELITLEIYFDFIQNNKIDLIDYKIPSIETVDNGLNKLLTMMLVYDNKERASSLELINKLELHMPTILDDSVNTNVSTLTNDSSSAYISTISDDSSRKNMFSFINDLRLVYNENSKNSENPESISIFQSLLKSQKFRIIFSITLIFVVSSIIIYFSVNSIQDNYKNDQSFSNLTNISEILSIDWSNGNWAFACDFKNNDLKSVDTVASQCGPQCRSTSGCTHFSWSTFNGGTCWMKKGSVSKSDAFYTGDKTMVCGVTGFTECTDNATALCTENVMACQTEFNNALTCNGYPLPSLEKYQYLVIQAESKGGIKSKQELAMFLSQAMFNSDGFSVTREYYCYPTLKPGCEYSSEFGYPDKYYFGRGYFLISWDYNYKAASEYLFGNADVLLRDPDQVASNNELSFLTAFWFWKMEVIGKSYGQQVLEGKFGASTNAINGANECRGVNTINARKRFEIYKNVLAAFNLNVIADETGCYN